MTPLFAMPDSAQRRRAAALADIIDALDAARCSARLARLETQDFLLRELLLAVVEQLGRAAGIVRRVV
ncbi:MAG TPA: hypothetical protein VJN39_06155 [Gemmatimonadales bacterium]|nr:hypothetical protein [Gemmatimonadales bacterium]